MAREQFHHEILVIYLLVVMYALSYQLNAPNEVFLVDKLVVGESSDSYARLQSFFAFVQMIGSLIVGFLLDRVGVRGAFILNFAACAASYALLAQATSIDLLFWSKVPAVFQTGFLCAQTAVAKLTPPGPRRVEVLGRLTMAYTIGATIGPTLGGFLGVTTGAWLAVAGSILSMGLVMTLPNSIDHHVHETEAPSKSSDEISPTMSWFSRASLAVSLTWFLLLTKISGGVVNSMGGAIQPLVLKDHFHLDEKQVGLFMSVKFFGTAVVGLVLGKLTGFIGGADALISTCLMSMGSGHLALGAVYVGGGDSHIPLLSKLSYVGMAFALALFQFPLATTITARSTGSVPPHVKGTLMGVEHALFAMAAMVGPRAGVYVMQEYGVVTLSVISSVVYFFVFSMWRIKPSALPTSEGEEKVKAP